MNQTINVLVIEDNEYYNNLIFNALRQSIHFVQPKMKCRMVLHSFIDSFHCMKQIESHEFIENDLIAFVDQYMPFADFTSINLLKINFYSFG